MKPVSDSVNHSDDSDADDINLLQQLKLNLEEENRLIKEFKRNMKDKEEEVATQAKTIEQLRAELDKEKIKSAQLLDSLNKEKGRRMEVENRMHLQEVDNGFSVKTPSPSSSGLVTTSTLKSVILPGTLDKPPQQSLKRKLEGEEAENNLQLKRTPPIPTPDATIPPSPTQPQFNSIPDLPTLPPLVFQLQSSQIKMGMYTEGKAQALKNASGSEFTPFIVGVTNQGYLEYGDGVTAILEAEQDWEQSEPTFWKYWWVTDKFLKCGNDAWSVNPTLHDGERHKITVEFLIGFIVKNLKSHVETQMKGTCATAVITVPFWYSSSQRTQVKNGVRLAGFPYVFLVNEGPAAIFACPSRDQKVSTSHNILVLSENSYQIDASIYSYSSHASSGAKRLVMIGHSGHYSQMGTGEPGGSTLELIVKKICTEALQNIQDKKHNPVGNTSLPAELITISESKKWGPFLEQVGKQFVTAFSNVDMDNENGVVLGAAILSQKPVDIQNIIIDKLAYDILANCDAHRPNRFIIEKEISRLCPKDVTPVRCKLVTHTFPSRCQFLRIFQLVLKRPVELFRITMQRPIPSSQRIVVSLILNDEGVVKFKDLAYISANPNRPITEKARVEDYVWKAPFLTLDELKKARAHLKECRQTPKPVNDAKQALLRKCVEMKKKLDQGTLPFKSDFVRSAFLKVLEYAGGIARDLNTTMEKVQGQMDILAKWNAHDK